MIKLFTHNDLDGVGCEIFAKYFYGKAKVDVEVCGYNDINEKFEEYLDRQEYKKFEETYMTDISISKELADKVENSDMGDFRILDHHRTAYYLKDYEFATITEKLNSKQKTSGAYMFFRYQFPKTEKSHGFFNMIRMYDTWEWKEVGDLKPKLLNDLFIFFGREKFVEIALKNLSNGNSYFVNDFDEILNTLQDNIKSYCKEKNNKMTKIETGKYTIGYVCAEQNISELGNYICENNDIDFAMININNESMSLRTIKDIDLSEIAKQNGGGGHPKASGFRIKHPNIDFTIK